MRVEIVLKIIEQRNVEWDFIRKFILWDIHFAAMENDLYSIQIDRIPLRVQHFTLLLVSPVNCGRSHLRQCTIPDGVWERTDAHPHQWFDIVLVKCETCVPLLAHTVLYSNIISTRSVFMKGISRFEH